MVTRQLFPNNQIPDQHVGSGAKTIQSLLPGAQSAGPGCNGIATNNYNYLAPGDAPKRKYFGRFDADVRSNNRITGSAAWNDGPARPFSPVAPLNLNPGDVMNMSGQLSDYWTISPQAHQRIPHRVHGRIRSVHPATIGQG